MRTIIAVSRDLWDYPFLLEAVAGCGWPITAVVCGGAAADRRFDSAPAFNIPPRKITNPPYTEGRMIQVMPIFAWRKHGTAAGSMTGPPSTDCPTRDVKFDGKAWRCAK